MILPRCRSPRFSAARFSAPTFRFNRSESFSWWRDLVRSPIRASSWTKDQARLTLNERKSHETSPPLPEPVALPQELQTESHPPHQAGDEVDLHLSSDALRSETTDQSI